MYIISERGRKSGVARATGATASLAPMPIIFHFFDIFLWHFESTAIPFPAHLISKYLVK